MKTKSKIATVFLLAALIFLAVCIHNQNILKRGMPPGYILQCDGAGRYRACFTNGRPLFDLDDPSTKLKAMKRAWLQYEFDCARSGEIWTNVSEQK